MAGRKTAKKKRAAPARARNAITTRDAILISAREVFALAGYDGAGVREIAEGAGVTAMLVNRYFGSKEQLFREALAAAMSDPVILAPALLRMPSVAESLARVMARVTSCDGEAFEGFQILLRSAGSERAAQIGREEIEKRHQKLLTALLGGEHAAVRAALLLALLAGVQIMRQTIKLTPLTRAADADLAQLLAPLIRTLFGDFGSSTAAAGSGAPRSF